MGRALPGVRSVWASDETDEPSLGCSQCRASDEGLTNARLQACKAVVADLARDDLGAGGDAVLGLVLEERDTKVNIERIGVDYCEADGGEEALQPIRRS